MPVVRSLRQRWTQDTGPEECVRKGEGCSSSSSNVYHLLLLLALWSCGRRTSVVQAQRQILSAHLGRPRHRRILIAQGLVGAALIVEAQPLADADTRLETIGISLQVDLFVLQAAPQPLDEYIVQPAPATVHADPHSGGFQLVGKRRAGKLRALVGVEDLWPPFPQSVFECVEAKRSVHRVRQTPSQNVPAVPVHGNHPVMAALHCGGVSTLADWVGAR